MGSILGQVNSCLNIITLDDDKGEDGIEDEDLIIKIMTGHTIKLMKYQRPSYWGSFNHQMQPLPSKSSCLRNLKHINA